MAKNRGKVVQKISVNPRPAPLATSPSIAAGSGIAIRAGIPTRNTKTVIRHHA